MIEPIQTFAELFGAKMKLDEKCVVHRGKRYFLFKEDMQNLVSSDFFYGGIYLGKTGKGKFLPSFELLRMIARQEANKVFINSRSEWLFICGRDLFRQGIIKLYGNIKVGSHVLVLNQNDECLGFGRAIADLSATQTGVVVKNLFDIGDFLRREREI